MGTAPSGAESPEDERSLEEDEEVVVGVPETGERPAADVQEQAQLVETYQVVKREGRHDEVNEADWLEQSVEESLDEDER